jgi:hypothetical protein
VSAGTAPDKSRLHGRSRDPFIQQGGKQPVGTAQASTSTPASGSTGSTTSGTSSTGSSGSTTGGTTGGSTGTSTGGSTTPTTPTIPTPTPAPPAPAGLTSTQAYSVSLAITDSSGGFNTLDPLERLSVLPSQKQPMLIELGVLKGGNRVLFVVQPGAAVNGPGTCTPGPIDCAILSLGVGAVENLGRQTAKGNVPVAQFAVTAVKANDYPSKSAADKARKQESAFGRGLLNKSTASALSLFQYDASVGAVIDLRNLKVGGS